MSLVAKILKHVPWRSGRRYSALDELDRKLESYIDFDGGFFVEAGANDGVRYSNTLYFERYRRWHGLLVEPIPDLAARCRKNRPNSIVENVALVPFGFEGRSVDMRYCDLMSLVKGAMKSIDEEDEHIRQGCACQSIESRELTVPAHPLSDLLDKHQVDRVDLLSLDVEGFELPVLKGLNFHRHAPRFMLVEARYRDELDGYLTPVYRVVAELSHHDVLYRRVQEGDSSHSEQ